MKKLIATGLVAGAVATFTATPASAADGVILDQKTYTVTGSSTISPVNMLGRWVRVQGTATPYKPTTYQAEHISGDGTLHDGTYMYARWTKFTQGRSSWYVDSTVAVKKLPRTSPGTLTVIRTEWSNFQDTRRRYGIVNLESWKS